MQNRGWGCFFVWEKRTYEYKGRVRVTVQNARILQLYLGPQNSIRNRPEANVWVLRFWNDVVLWNRARTVKTLKYIMVPVNNSKPSFSSSVFICIHVDSTILVHAWPLFLNLRDLQRSRNSVKNSTSEASSVEFSDRFPGFADSRPDFQTYFWFWDSGLSRNFMLFCGPEFLYPCQ